MFLDLAMIIAVFIWLPQAAAPSVAMVYFHVISFALSIRSSKASVLPRDARDALRFQFYRRTGDSQHDVARTLA